LFDAVVEHVVDEPGEDPEVQREPVDSFLLGYLLLETSAMALRDPKPRDGSFSTRSVQPTTTRPNPPTRCRAA